MKRILKRCFAAFRVGKIPILLCKTTRNSTRKECFRKVKAMVYKW